MSSPPMINNNESFALNPTQKLRPLLTTQLNSRTIKIPYFTIHLTLIFLIP